MTSQQIDAEALYQSLVAQLRTRMAGTPAGDWSVAGIVSGGAWIAARLAHDLGLREYGIVNVALHRDDYAKKGLHAQAQPTTLPFEVEERRILLVDDVLATGRTIRAAINELFDYGRPAAVEPGRAGRPRRASVAYRARLYRRAHRAGGRRVAGAAPGGRGRIGTLHLHARAQGRLMPGIAYRFCSDRFRLSSPSVRLCPLS